MEFPDVETAHMVPVNLAECARMREMATREPYLAGALNRLCRGISVNEMTMPTDGLEALSDEIRPLAQQQLRRQFWGPVALEYLRSKLMTGYLPYQIEQRRVVVEANGSVRFVTPKSPKAEGPHDVRVVVPTIPDPSTYRVFVGITKQRQPYVMCEPVEDARFEKAEVHVVFTDPKFLPDTVKGTLRSPLSSLMYAYNMVETYDGCEMQAVYASVNPSIVYQNVVRKEGDSGDSMPEMASGMAIMTMGSTNPIEDKIKVNVRMQNYAARVVEANAARNASGDTATMGIAQDKSVPLRDTMSSGRHHFLPLDMTLAPNVPVPRVPDGLAARWESYRNNVSVVLGIPSSYLGQSSSGRNVSVFGDIETADFVETLSSTARDIESALGQMYLVAMTRPGEFAVPIFAMQTVDRLRDIYALGAIDHATLRANIFRITGVQTADHDTRETEMPVEGWLATKRLELDERRLELENKRVELDEKRTEDSSKLVEAQAKVATAQAAQTRAGLAQSGAPAKRLAVSS